MRNVWWCVALLVACGPSNPSDLARLELQVTSSAEPLTLTQGQEVLVVLSVFYDGKKPLTYSAENLPSFAVLEGNRLRLEPTSREHTGDFLITLHVTDGHKTDSEDLRVHVDRLLHAPRIWVSIQNGTTMRSANFVELCFDECYPTDGTFVHFNFTDEDGDPVSIELEVVAQEAEGQPRLPFTGEASFASDPVPLSVYHYPSGDSSLPQGKARIYFSDPQIPAQHGGWGSYSTFFKNPLPTGKWYRGRYRAKDASGSVSAWENLYSFFVFDRAQ